MRCLQLAFPSHSPLQLLSLAQEAPLLHCLAWQHCDPWPRQTTAAQLHHSQMPLSQMTELGKRAE
jgi:hypothetical protein